MPRRSHLLALSLLLAWPGAAMAVARIAVLPPENVARAPGGREVVLSALAVALASKGYEVVVGPPIDQFLRAGRIRYLDSLRPAQADELLEAVGADAILLGSLLTYSSAGREPDVALVLNLLGRGATLLWTASAGLTSADTVEAFGRGRVADLETLARRVINAATESLPREVVPSGLQRRDERFRGARSVFRAALPGRGQAAICVLPLQNRAEDKAAPRVMEALIQKVLSERPGLRVVSPADLRHAVVADGLRAPSRLGSEQLRALGKSVGTPLFLQGTILEYAATYTGYEQSPAVEIYLSLFDAETGQTLWSGLHRRTGLDYEGLLKLGAITDPTTVASRVVAELVDAFTHD
jgi:hypothetical protein